VGCHVLEEEDPLFLLNSLCCNQDQQSWMLCYDNNFIFEYTKCMISESDSDDGVEGEFQGATNGGRHAIPEDSNSVKCFFMMKRGSNLQTSISHEIFHLPGTLWVYKILSLHAIFFIFVWPFLDKDSVAKYLY
jgi:hypothetical protein